MVRLTPEYEKTVPVTVSPAPSSRKTFAPTGRFFPEGTATVSVAGTLVGMANDEVVEVIRVRVPPMDCEPVRGQTVVRVPLPETDAEPVPVMGNFAEMVAEPETLAEPEPVIGRVAEIVPLPETDAEPVPVRG